jgi:hypothetical protein
VTLFCVDCAYFPHWCAYFIAIFNFFEQLCTEHLHNELINLWETGLSHGEASYQELMEEAKKLIDLQYQFSSLQRHDNQDLPF